MAGTTDRPQPVDDQAYPGQWLGLPERGPSSLASWAARITALVLDWAASMIISVAIFGPGGLTGRGWRSFVVLGMFFVITTCLTAITGASLGQLITRITVARLDRRRLGWPRAVLRTLMICAVIPALVVDANRRGLHDLVCGTAVLNRR